MTSTPTPRETPASKHLRRHTGMWVRLPWAARISLAYLVALFIVCAFSPLVAPHAPLSSDLTEVLQGPNREYLLGTDRLGRDVLSRLLYGGRAAMVGAAEAGAVFALLGVSLGVVAGYLGRATDWVVSRIAEVVAALPGILVLLVVLAAFSHNEHAAMIAFGTLASPGLIRVIRAETMRLRRELYVSAARLSGLSNLQILVRHIVPRLTSTVTVQTALCCSVALVVQAGLGFLGLGAQEPTPSWGGLVNQAQQSLVEQPFLLVPSGGVIALTVLTIGLLADGLRDASTARWTRTATGDPLRMRPRTHLLPSATNTPPRTLLSVRQLSVAIKDEKGTTTVVEDVSFDLDRGEVLGLVGESGSGKSVSMAAVLGLLSDAATISGSRCTFDGEELLTMSPSDLQRLRGTRIGFVSQEPLIALDPTKRVGTLLSEAIRTHQRVGRSESTRRAYSLLAAVHLPAPRETARKFPFQLSGGMAQRVAIALALAGDPDLLIADEPTTALDVTVQAEILELLARLRAERGLAILIVSHDWGVIAEIADRALVMYAGNVVEVAGTATLCQLPAHPYTRALLAADPTRAIELAESAGTPLPERLPSIPGSVLPPGAWPIGCHFQDRCSFVTTECRTAPIALAELSPGHSSRCIRSDVPALNGTAAR